MTLYRRRLAISVLIGSLSLLSGLEIPLQFADEATVAAASERAQVRSFLETRRTHMADVELTNLTEVILVEARAADLDPQLILAVIQVESSGNRMAVSRVGAMGLMQLRPETARAISPRAGLEWDGPEMLFDPEKNVRLGVAYLAYLIERFGDVDTALAAYNWGPTRIARDLREGDAVPVRYTERVRKVYAALI